VNGSRANYTTIASQSVSIDDIVTIEYDLGSGNTSSSDYFIVSRADLILAQGASFTVKHATSTDDITYTDRESVVGLSSSNLFGTESEDLLITTGGGVSTRYHQFLCLRTSVSSFTIDFNKIYFGPAFDFGVDPVYPRRLERVTVNDKDRRSKYVFSLTWRGVTETIRNSFIEKILRYKDINPVFLYTTTYHDVLNEHRLLHCIIKGAIITPIVSGRTDITLDFEELI